MKRRRPCFVGGAIEILLIDWLIENREIFIPHLYLSPRRGWPRRNFVKMFDADKNRMIGLPCGEKNCDDMLSRFHLIPERHGQTDRQTDLLYQYHASIYADAR